MSKLGDRIKRKRLLNGNFERTPKGECFMEYCRGIVEGTLSEKDRIYEYDKTIDEIIYVAEHNEGIALDRYTTAQVLLSILKKGKGAFDE